MTAGIITTAVRHLMEAGMSGERLLAAIADIEAALPQAKDTSAERRRARDREYQAERRRQKSAESAESSDRADSVPPKENKSNPPSLKPSPIGDVKKPTKSKKGRSFEFETPDWFNPDETEAWTAFARMRFRKGKPVDDYTAKQLFGRLRSIADAGWNITDVMVKATVAQHDGFWMPDGKDSNIRRANEPRAGPVNMDEYKERLARIGQSVQ